MSEHPLPASVAATLEQGLASMGLDAALAPPLLRYLALLHRWNGTYNLTAIRDPQEMVTRHLLDSLAMQPFVADGSLADLGTGPGLPGIPLAIACPGLQVTWSRATARRRASCAKPCASSAWATPAWPNRAPRRWTRPAATTS
jgi:16S rRNA (guanine527-N7)-methyltransferase